MGDLPQALATGDFNRDGQLDLAVADYRRDLVLVLTGRGDGTFLQPQAIAVGRGPVAILAADLTGDGRLDLALANFLSNDVALLAGLGNGSFGRATRLAVGTAPVAVVAGDYDGDGRADLATANCTSDDITLLLGLGGGAFAKPLSRPVGDYPVGLLSADFNDDARLDLALATHLEFDVSVLQGLGDASFVAAGTLSNPRLSSPLVADWNHDGAADTVVLNREGKIFLRLARPHEPGLFQAPFVVNPSLDVAARDIAFVTTPGGLVLAALDARHSSVSLYSLGPGDTFTRIVGPAIPGTLPIALRSGDLSGDGLDDLAVVAAGSSQVFVYLQGAAGFSHPAPDYTLAVGASPSSLELADLGGDGRLGIAVTNQFSGDVSVLVNDVTAPFAREQRYRAAESVFSFTNRLGAATVRSSLAPTDVIGGDFNLDGTGDLIVASGGANVLAVLRGTSAGGFLNATLGLTYSTDLRPLIVVAGSLNGDAYPDLAVLNEGSANLSIFLGTNDGGLTEQAIRPAAGNVPTGLAVHDVNGDGRQDLLVGNDFGDLLVLLGNGDGTFQPYQRADGRVALAVTDVDGDGAGDFIFASQANDSVEVQYSRSAGAFRQLRTDGLRAPEAVATADLDRDGALDLIVANTGANNVLVHLGTRTGQFASARIFFAGTSPVSVTVHELNGDALPDLIIANEGSNDVTVLLGQTSPAGWTLANGPRLRAGSGPVQTIVRDETSDGIPDILVTNGQSNDIFLLAGLGLGFFDDRNPVVRSTGEQPRTLLPVGSGLVTINERSNDITFFLNFLSLPGLTFSSGGERPVAGLAGNFNGDAFSDLLVANQGSGVIRMLAGGPSGFSLADSFSRGDLPHPAALASVLRGQQLEIYGVNERGSQAVLVTALVDSALRPPDPSPIPLAGLLLVVGPGFELAMSVLTADPIAIDPQVPGTVLVAKAGDGDSAPDFVDGSGSGEQTPDENGEQKPESDSNDGEDRRAHDAAILELLSGVDDALELRPPKLPLEQSAAVQPERPAPDAGGHEESAQSLKAILAWITNPNMARVVGQLPLPPGMGAVTEVALAVVHGWFQEFAASETAAAAVLKGYVPDATGVDGALADTDASTTDLWLAAGCALGLASGACSFERNPSECDESTTRCARFSRRPRPLS